MLYVLQHFLMLQHFKNQMDGEGLKDTDNSSVFSEVLAVMNHFSDELIKEICHSVMLEISAKSRAYRKDRSVYEVELSAKYSRVCESPYFEPPY